MNRDDVLQQAVDNCLKEIYSFVQPSVDWIDFIKHNEIYGNNFKKWERFKFLDKKNELTEDELSELTSYPEDWKGKSIEECIGPKPYEFYYIPKEILKDITDSYIYAYRLDQRGDFLDNISVLKDYCNSPIVDKWIEEEGDNPGYRGYDHPDNIFKEIAKIISKYSLEEAKEDSDDVIEICNKFFEFLDMAGEFYNWNRDLNTFNMSVYLGPSPNSNKEAVIENWKKYYNKDIEINEEEIKKQYYGEELD